MHGEFQYNGIPGSTRFVIQGMFGLVLNKQVCTGRAHGIEQVGSSGSDWLMVSAVSCILAGLVWVWYVQICVCITVTVPYRYSMTIPLLVMMGRVVESCFDTPASLTFCTR
jgi:hypothetical protein